MKARAMMLISSLLSRTHPHLSTMMERSRRERMTQMEFRTHLGRQPLPLMGRSSKPRMWILLHQGVFPLEYVLLGIFKFRTHPSWITL
jgi:hypothetical protein